ncbi:hypothetical protein JCM5353_007619 [Sporobolomyces roseus]
MALVHQNGPKIDHFSSLPNEILQDIFELVQPSFPARTQDQSSTYMLISKRCLPFIRSNIYRAISLSSPKQIDAFFQTIYSDRALGGIVRTLTVHSFQPSSPSKGNSSRGTTETARKLRRLFHLLPNLDSFSLYERMENIDAIPLMAVPLQHLRKLNIVVPPVDSKVLDLDDFQWIAAIPSLHDLRLSDWDHYDECYISDSVTFPHLQKLGIDGNGAAESSVAVLAAVCPSLVDVSLISYQVDVPAFEHCLPSFPLNLERLFLSSLDRNLLAIHLLLRFQQLTHLVIGDYTCSPQIHLILLQLPNLIEISVGDNSWNARGMQQLVHGPRRLLKLQEVALDFEDRYVGYRFDPEDAEDLAAFRDGTYLPFEDWSTNFDEWTDVQELIRLGIENGVKMGGSALETTETIDAFILETYNLAIARAFYLANPSTLQHAQNLASTHSFTLPRLDYDGTNLEELDLVKTEREEQGWFALTLRKRTV